MFFLVFVLFLDCFFYMHLCAKLQPYSSKIFMCFLLITILPYDALQSMSIDDSKREHKIGHSFIC